MAEENLSPISAPQPPAVNPLGAATAAHASTLKLKPVIRKPTIGGGLKPGLKLPTQTGLKPGLKLPTQTALRRPTLGAAPASAPAPAAPAAPAVNTAKEQEILAAVIAAVTEDLGPSASRMQITSINKI